MEGKKYRIREDMPLKLYDGITLYRIEALKDFGDVKKGDLGGWIEKELNLSQSGTCWVYDEAVVYQNARVSGKAIIRDNAEVCGYAMVTDNAMVFDNSSIHGQAILENDVSIHGNALICGNAKISNNAQIYDRVTILDNAHVYGYTYIFNNVQIYDNAKVHGHTEIYGNIHICGDAEIKSITDYYVGNNTWSSGRYFVYTRSNKKWCVGCFYGTSEELIKKAYKDSKLSGQEYERVVKYVEEMYNNLEKHNKHT